MGLLAFLRAVWRRHIRVAVPPPEFDDGAKPIGVSGRSARWRLSRVEVSKRRSLSAIAYLETGWQLCATGKKGAIGLPIAPCHY
jgi:hypothetical protein